MNLDRISPELEGGLERARLLAEEHKQAQITPFHMLYILLEEEGAFAAVIARNSASVGPLLDFFATQLKSAPARLEAGRRPTASTALRNLIEKCFIKADERDSERAEPIDFLLAAIEFGEENLKTALQQAGLTPQSVAKAAETHAATRETLGDPVKARPVVPSGLRMLERFGRDLTAAAEAGELMPTIGRDEEIRHVVQTLLRKTKNNPVLVGDPGTGKTAVVEGLATRIAMGDAPDSLRKCKVYALDLTAMVAGAKYRGEFEERIKGVVDEVRSRKGEIILFLDELHTLVGAGANEGGMDAANILKPALARGELRCIGATTYDEYRERIEQDGALARRFDVVVVKEPDDAAMIAILRGIRARYETYHGVKLTEDSLHAAIKLSRRYLRNRFLPDKAIDVIDEATARIRMQKESKPNEIDRLERELVRKKAELAALRDAQQTGKHLDDLQKEIEDLQPRVDALSGRWQKQRASLDKLQQTRQAIQQQSAALEAAEASGDVTKAAEIRYGSLKFLEQQRADLEGELAESAGNSMVPEEVRPEHIAEVVAQRAGVPIDRMLESERDRLLRLEERIAQRVFGQRHAISSVAEASRRMRADLRIGQRPNSFLFVGPTGVGKTELAKALAEALFDDENALIRIDMGEYKDQSSTAGLIGSRPGLVGSDEGGFLTEQVRRSPYSVVLFDEIEKAHPQVLDLLLGALDDGRLTDAKGRFCDFSNTTVIFTSNLGVREANALTDDVGRHAEIILATVKAMLRPEFFNRISQVVVFDPLTEQELEKIVETQLQVLSRKLNEERQIELIVSPEALCYLARESYDPSYGARPVGRTIQQLVLSPIATAILAQDVMPGQALEITYTVEEGLSISACELSAVE